MAKAQDKLMQGVAYAAQCLLITNDEYRGISQALAILGSVLDADAIRIFQYYEDEQQLRFEQRFEWSIESLVCQIGEEMVSGQFNNTLCVPLEHGLFQKLSIGESLIRYKNEVFPDTAKWMEKQELNQLVFVPILIDDAFWGYVEMGCKDLERKWTTEEQAAMEMTATGIGGLIKRRNVQQALRKSHSELLAVTSALGEGLFVLDRQGLVTFINPEGERLLGYSRKELLGNNIHAILHGPNDRNKVDPLTDCPIYRAIEKGESMRCDDDVFQVKSGEMMAVSYVSTPIVEQGKITGTVVAFSDITQRKRAEEKLRMAAAVYENTAEGVFITDPKGKIISVNPAFAQITGYSLEQVLQKELSMMAADVEARLLYRKIWQKLLHCGHWQGVVKHKSPLGEEYIITLNVSAIRNHLGHTIQYVGIFSDITAHKLYEEQIHYQAFHDVLTGLPNRRAFENELNLNLFKKRPFVLLLIDLDGFKVVNDLYGHEVGDKLLKQVAQRMQEALPKSSKTFRLGGDEFTVLLLGQEKLEENKHIIKVLIDMLQKPFLVYNLSVRVTSSVGASRFPEDESSHKTVIEQADLGMYRAKELGKNQFVFYHELGLKE